MRKAIVTDSYYPVAEGELELIKGDEVTVLDDIKRGWLKGRVGQEEGVFRTHYIEFVSEPTLNNRNQPPSMYIMNVLLYTTMLNLCVVK